MVSTQSSQRTQRIKEKQMYYNKNSVSSVNSEFQSIIE